jgi:hypothetical protein
MHGRVDKGIKILVRKLKGRDNLGDLGEKGA